MSFPKLSANTIKPILERNIKEVEGYNFKPSGGTWFDNKTEEAYLNLSEKMETCNRYFNFYFIIQYVRLCNAKTLSCLPVNEMIYQSTLTAINMDFKEIVDDRKQFTNFLEKNIPEFDAKYSKASTDLKFQQKLLSELSQIDKSLQSKEKSVSDLTLDIEKQLEYKKISTTTDDKFYIELDENNNVITMKRLEKHT